ncbi:hypothetical protein Tco_0732340 [Tanacetum coccineum]
MQEVVKKEIMKLLDTSIIYPTTDSPWVSPIHCVPKKGGITLVINENDELIPTRTVMGWRVCNDYHKLNEATAKDHFPLPFMDQMRMPFGLCNAPTAFQRCMLAIFHDMIEESVEMLILSLIRKNVTSWSKKELCLDTSPNWNLPFELMCDASDLAVGAILGQKDEIDIEIKDRKGTENVAADHLSRIENDESSDDSDVDDNFPGETLMEINTKDEPWFADFANYLVAKVIPKGMTYQQKNKFFSNLKHYFWEKPYLFKVCSDGIIRRCISGSKTQIFLDQRHYRPTDGHYGPNVTAKKVLDSGFY